MSTKTTFKRVALVAVASLGFGLLSSVSPASAAEPDVTTDVSGIYVNGVLANYNLVQREDVAFTVSAGIDIDGTTTVDADEDVTLKAVFTSKPAASTLVAVSSTAADTMDSTGSNVEGTLESGATVSVDGDGTTPASLKADPASGKILIDDANIGSFDFTPDVPGTYVVRVWHDQNADGFYNAGTEVTRTITVVAGGTPASATVTTYGATSSVTNAGIVDDFEDGSFIKVLLKDAAGNATKLAAGEGLTVTGTGTVTLNGTADSITLTSSTSQDISGDYSINVKKAAVGASVVTIAPAGTIASAFASQTSTLSFVAVTEQDVVAGVINETTGVDATAAGTGASPAAIAAATTKTSVAYKLTTAAAQTSVYVAINVVDTTGSITGVAGASYTEAVLTADAAAGTAAYSVTPATWSATTRAATGVAGADAYTIAVADDSTANSLGWTVTATTPANSASLSTWNISSVSAVSGASVSATLTVKDQFGLARSGQAVVFAIAGRNAAITTGLNAVTDASGKATFTYTDAGTATSATTDTISASAGGTSVTATVSVSFDAGNAVSTVVVNSGDTTDGVANLFVSYKDILAGTAGASSSANDVTATVKNAAGTALAGVSVTFTVAGTGCAIPSNEVTVFTGSTGIATSAVYAWLEGKCTITATAGGKTGTGVTSFRQETSTEIRTLSGSVAGTVVTAAPKDRFGNPVVNGTVYAVITAGNGYFGANGARTATLTTSAAGTATVVVAGGDATVKLTTIDPAGTGLATDQSTAAAGNVRGDVATPVVFTATTVGTATTAETGVGASFAPAGVSSVTLEVSGDNSASAAADAAAEATDAANAATDAANAAAEAADAATAAAQDAADAVAALSTQVSEMVDALKKQITALTNLVIKIQKKVRA
jgi:trimeric autotransporter adhesin